MVITKDILSILKVGYEMARETVFMPLYELLIKSCVPMTDADGGAIYIVGKNAEDQSRLFLMAEYSPVLLINRRADTGGEIVEIPDTETELLNYVYHHPMIRRISDIYAEDVRFDITGFREWDELNHYHTKSIMAVPICVDEKDVRGVMLLYNHRDPNGEITSFPDELSPLVSSLSTQMANTMKNQAQIDDLEDLLSSFVHSLTTAIDSKTPYNGKHTIHVRDYCHQMVEFINAARTRGETDLYVTERDEHQLLMAALLHDIGKLIVPSSILNKSTRLGSGYEVLKKRLEQIRMLLRIDELEGREDYNAMDAVRLDNFLEKLPQINGKPELTMEDIDSVERIASQVYRPAKGREIPFIVREPGIDVTQIPYLTPQEKDQLTIRRGTLTLEEKGIVQEHVVYTDRILADIKFIDRYDKVRAIAANHHEYLDGSGYPNHLTAKDLDLLTRIITVCDIYDSLRADDRPYKKAIPFQGAVKILRQMVGEGKLDGEIVEILAKNMGKEGE